MWKTMTYSEKFTDHPCPIIEQIFRTDQRIIERKW